KQRRLQIVAKSFNGTCCGRRAGLGTHSFRIDRDYIVRNKKIDDRKT
ncbi:hypothetical protein ALC57_02326, partial [Trachymyrmex cornetzi]